MAVSPEWMTHYEKYLELRPKSFISAHHGVTAKIEFDNTSGKWRMCVTGGYLSAEHARELAKWITESFGPE